MRQKGLKIFVGLVFAILLAFSGARAIFYSDVTQEQSINEMSNEFKTKNKRSVCEQLIFNIQSAFRKDRRNSRFPTVLYLDATINTYGAVGGVLRCGKRVWDILKEAEYDDGEVISSNIKDQPVDFDTWIEGVKTSNRALIDDIRSR